MYLGAIDSVTGLRHNRSRFKAATNCRKEDTMPIIRMTDNPPADAVNVRIYEGSSIHKTLIRYNGEVQQNLNPQIPLDEQPEQGYEYSSLLWLYDTHVGLCISDYERNGYDDSDFYMVVWNWEKMHTETIEFASTRGWSYPAMGSKPDATPEVLAAYAEWQKKIDADARRERQEAESRLPKKGRTVRVIKGRKLPKGTIAKVFWTGCNQFQTYYRNGYNQPNQYDRLGLELEDGSRVFVAGANVEVVQ